MKTFLKLFSSYLILILLTVVVFDFLLTPRINRLMTESIENEMFGMARAISLIPLDNIGNRIPELSRQLDVRITVIDYSGKVLSESSTDRNLMDNHLNRPEILQAKNQGQGKSARFSTTLRESMLYVAIPVKDKEAIRGYVRLSRPLTKLSESLDHLKRSLYISLYIIVIPSLFLAFIFSRIIYSRFVGSGEKNQNLL